MGMRFRLLKHSAKKSEYAGNRGRGDPRRSGGGSEVFGRRGKRVGAGYPRSRGKWGKKNRNIAQYFAIGKARRDGNWEFIVDHSTESEKFRSAYLVCLPGFDVQKFIYVSWYS